MPTLSKLFNNILLHLKSSDCKEVKRLIDVLFLHGFYHRVMCNEGNLRAKYGVGRVLVSQRPSSVNMRGQQ